MCSPAPPLPSIRELLALCEFARAFPRRVDELLARDRTADPLFELRNGDTDE